LNKLLERIRRLYFGILTKWYDFLIELG
jgi:hypothetical protein